MFQVKRFEKKKHFEMLTQWWKHYGHPVADESELNETGLLVCWEDKPVLCGFLILTSAKFALLETVCANPETHWEDREVAIKILTEEISKLAKSFGFRRLLAFPQNERLMEKGREAGWVVLNQKSFVCVKEL